jgi:hypothetical protein
MGTATSGRHGPQGKAMRIITVNIDEQSLADIDGMVGLPGSLFNSRSEFVRHCIHQTIMLYRITAMPQTVYKALVAMDAQNSYLDDQDRVRHKPKSNWSNSVEMAEAAKAQRLALLRNISGNQDLTPEEEEEEFRDQVREALRARREATSQTPAE